MPLTDVDDENVVLDNGSDDEVSSSDVDRDVVSLDVVVKRQDADRHDIIFL